MNFNQFNQIISKIKYRDWKIEPVILDNATFDYAVKISYPAADSDAAFYGDPEPPVSTVQSCIGVSGWLLRDGGPFTEAALVDHIFASIRSMAVHEVGEWFVYNGTRPHYPHQKAAVL